jgi:uncharacterized membrane-anchored protein
MGEATSDFLVIKINPYLAVFLGGIALLIALILQFRAKRYVAWIYWLAVAMVAVFGTMAADALHIQLGVPYTVSTCLFAVVLAGVFIVWQKSEKTLSIHSINTRRREVFYWATVLATFALGTAAGDWTATTLGLGYFSSILLFSGLIIVPAVGFWLFRLNEIAAFWAAYVLTRPIGASIADWAGKPKSVGGLAWGNGRVAMILTLIIVCFVVYLTISKVDIKRRS